MEILDNAVAIFLWWLIVPLVSFMFGVASAADEWNKDKSNKDQSKLLLHNWLGWTCVFSILYFIVWGVVLLFMAGRFMWTG